MHSKIDFDLYFKMGLQEIRQIRAPHSKMANMDELNWHTINQQKIFHFDDADFLKQANILNKAKQISLICVHRIIIDLFRYYQITFDEIKLNENPSEICNVYFVLKDRSSNMLLLFCDTVKDKLWKIGNDSKVKKLIANNNVKDCKYVFMMYDMAYLQLMYHNEDENDASRGTNFYALKWLFEEYFSLDDFILFKHSLKRYLKSVGECLGYSTVRSLTPSALINFKRITENTIIEFSYQNLKQKVVVDRNNNSFCLKSEEYKKLWNQFILNHFYTIMLSDKDYAESLITAEWLYDSMKKAQAIDLTVIGMGYLKSIEQFLFELICLHSNEKRLIRRKGTNKLIELNESNVKLDNIDSTIGSMASFYKYNYDLFKSDLDTETKSYIKESIYKYAELRNKFFHKNNIHEWKIIDQIRTETFYMFYLLLGSHYLSEENLIKLGKIDDKTIFTDYYRLCEYMNYHGDDIYILKYKNGEERYFWRKKDPKINMTNSGFISYSGIYLKELGHEGKRLIVTEKSLLQKSI